jgi:hypothetical protein
MLYAGGHQQGPRYFVDSEGRARPLVVDALDTTRQIPLTFVLMQGCAHVGEQLYSHAHGQPAGGL